MNKLPNEVLANMFAIESDLSIIRAGCAALQQRCKPIIQQALLMRFHIKPEGEENGGYLFQGAFIVAHTFDLTKQSDVSRVNHDILLEVGHFELNEAMDIDLIRFATILFQAYSQMHPEKTENELFSQLFNGRRVLKPIILGGIIAKTIYKVSWSRIGSMPLKYLLNICNTLQSPHRKKNRVLEVFLQSNPWDNLNDDEDIITGTRGIDHIMTFYDILALPVAHTDKTVRLTVRNEAPNKLHDQTISFTYSLDEKDVYRANRENVYEQIKTLRKSAAHGLVVFVELISIETIYDSPFSPVNRSSI